MTLNGACTSANMHNTAAVHLPSPSGSGGAGGRGANPLTSRGEIRVGESLHHHDKTSFPGRKRSTGLSTSAHHNSLNLCAFPSCRSSFSTGPAQRPWLRHCAPTVHRHNLRCKMVQNLLEIEQRQQYQSLLKPGVRFAKEVRSNET